MSAGDAKKCQQFYKYFLQHSKFPSERPQVRTWGHQTRSLLRAPRHLTSLRPCQGDPCQIAVSQPIFVAPWFQPSCAHHRFVATCISQFYCVTMAAISGIYSKSVYSSKLQHRSLVKAQPVLPTGIHTYQIWKLWYIFKVLGIQIFGMYEKFRINLVYFCRKMHLRSNYLLYCKA